MLGFPSECNIDTETQAVTPLWYGFLFTELDYENSWIYCLHTTHAAFSFTFRPIKPSCQKLLQSLLHQNSVIKHLNLGCIRKAYLWVKAIMVMDDLKHNTQEPFNSKHQIFHEGSRTTSLWPMGGKSYICTGKSFKCVCKYIKVRYREKAWK